MQDMSVAGRRGEVLWKSGGFIAGGGQQRTYDTNIVLWGFIIPFTLGDTVHIWDIPATKFEGPCKAIKLRPDAAFKQRTLHANYVGISAGLAFVGSLALLTKVSVIAGVLAILLAIGLAVTAWFMSRDPRRNADIRLLIGFHEWGSSDPAFWSKRILRDVKEPSEFGTESYAALARRRMKKGDWAAAMWAARLSVALRDGDDLTDEILNAPEVLERLPLVRRNPKKREEEFGEGPDAAEYLNCDPEVHIDEVN